MALQKSPGGLVCYKLSEEWPPTPALLLHTLTRPSHWGGGGMHWQIGANGEADLI